jgi:two-component system OmpR family response regulator
MKILLAEDDPSIRIIAKMTLQKVGGHEVVAVINGKEAYETALDQKFDLIILDHMMPIMDGLETCQKIKKNPAIKNVPVIFMTAKNQKADIEAGFNVGAMGYIVKPFDAKELCNEIQKIYSKHLFEKVS